MARLCQATVINIGFSRFIRWPGACLIILQRQTTMTTYRLFGPLLGLVFLHCGDPSTDNAEPDLKQLSPGDAGGPADASEDASDSGTASEEVQPCPLGPPSVGDDCSGFASRKCEYGNDIRIPCRINYVCFTTWSIEYDYIPNCSVNDESHCPSVKPSSHDICDSSLQNVTCTYADTLCYCSACLYGSCAQDAYFYCAPQPSPQCPAIAPNTGQACSEEALDCTYGAICTQNRTKRVCTLGIWTDEVEPFSCDS